MTDVKSDIAVQGTKSRGKMVNSFDPAAIKKYAVK